MRENKSEKRIRIEGLLSAGVAPRDIAQREGVSRQRVHQIKLALAEHGFWLEASLDEKQAAMKARITRRAERKDRHDAKVAQLRAEFLARTPQFKPLSTEELLGAARRHLRMVPRTMMPRRGDNGL